MARRSLRSPSSWATEINLQSRYPGGIVTPKIGAASPSACPDAGAMEAITPAAATTATSAKTIRLIRGLLQICVSEPLHNLAIANQGYAPRLAERSEPVADLL